MYDAHAVWFARLEEGLLQRELAVQLGLDEEDICLAESGEPSSDVRAVLEVWLASRAA